MQKLCSGSTVYRLVAGPLKIVGKGGEEFGAPNSGCGWWLRDEVPHLPDTANNMAELGTDAHELFEICSLHGETKARERKEEMECDPKRPWAPQLGLLFFQWRKWFMAKPQLTHHMWYLEMPFKYNVYTQEADFIPPDPENPGRRNYKSADPTKHITCTADLIIDTGDSLTVYDYKTGANPVPASDPQMLFMGLVAARHFKRDTVTVVVVTVRQDGVTERALTLDATMLNQLAVAFKTALANIPNSQPNPGPYCRYCPARDACPEVLEYLKDLPPQNSHAPFSFSAHIANDAHAIWTATSLAIAKDFIERVELQLKAYADSKENGLALSDSVRYSGKEQVRCKPKLTQDARNWLKSNGLFGAVFDFTTWEKLQAEVDKKGLDMDIQKTFKERGWFKEEVSRVYKSRKV